MNHAARTFVTTVITVFVGVVLFAGGFVAGHFTVLPDIPGLPALGLPTSAGGTPAGLQATFAPFWQAWTISVLVSALLNTCVTLAERMPSGR